MSPSFQHIIDNPLNVQCDNCPAPFLRLEEDAVVGVVVDEILRQSCGTESILQDVKVAFPVGISFGVVLPEFVAGKPERCGLVEAIGKPVTSRPAVGIHPMLSVAGSVGVDGDQADIAFAQLPAPGVHTFGAGPE